MSVCTVDAMHNHSAGKGDIKIYEISTVGKRMVKTGSFRMRKVDAFSVVN